MQKQGYEVFTQSLDVKDEEAVKASLAKCREKFGPIDILINNAGILIHGFLFDLPSEKSRLAM
jgi:NAD(P)-dependent dehydrogenase (short-subunit alcohol dehydrogenase family)